MMEPAENLYRCYACAWLLEQGDTAFRCAWLLDEAVWIEPVSASNFPDQQGKYREFLRFRHLFGGESTKKLKWRLGFFSKFPTQWNRELFLGNRDLFP
jgi:hypothetical protein